MPEPIDKKLYNKVKKLADKKFESPTSVYKSSWIVKEYKKLGGQYEGEKTPNKGLTRWYKEEWVDLKKPLGSNLGYEKCGRNKPKKDDEYPLCRPSKRITKETPKTYKEINPFTIEKAKKEKKSSKKISFVLVEKMKKK